MRALVAALLLFLALACNAAPTADSAEPVRPAVTGELSDVFVDRLQAFLSQETGVPVAEVAVQQAEPTNWSDSCLGAPQPDEFCLLAITPGYRVTLITPQGNYLVHSDRPGRSFRLVQTP
jgi:hypothetical protein